MSKRPTWLIFSIQKHQTTESIPYWENIQWRISSHCDKSVNHKINPNSEMVSFLWMLSHVFLLNVKLGPNKLIFALFYRRLKSGYWGSLKLLKILRVLIFHELKCMCFVHFKKHHDLDVINCLKIKFLTLIYWIYFEGTACSGFMAPNQGLNIIPWTNYLIIFIHMLSNC